MNLEHLLTDETKAIRDSIRDFVNGEIMPLRGQLEDDYSLVEGSRKAAIRLNTVAPVPPLISQPGLYAKKSPRGMPVSASVSASMPAGFWDRPWRWTIRPYWTGSYRLFVTKRPVLPVCP
jgi:hypothetical protein